jgi:hypothetical protein
MFQKQQLVTSKIFLQRMVTRMRCTWHCHDGKGTKAAKPAAATKVAI